MLEYGILFYQLLTLLIGFGAQVYVLALHGRTPSPLSRRYLRFSLPFTLFYLLISFAATVFRSQSIGTDELEVWGNLFFLLLYASMVPPWAAFVLELLQRPYRGGMRLFARLLAALGAALAGFLLLGPFDPVSRQQVLRLVLQAVYLPMVLVFLLSTVVLLWRGLAALSDDWKQTTGRGIAMGILLGFPLFVLDSLWPWLQLQLGWIPRGFNLHGLFFAGFNLYFAIRWANRLQDGLQTKPPPVWVADLERVRALALTFREEEVLRLVFDGKSNQEIADALQVSLGTIKNHVYHIFQKSGASARKELIEMLS